MNGDGSDCCVWDVNKGTFTISGDDAPAWSLDTVGNWTTFVTDTNGGGIGGQTTRTRTHNRRNRITSITGQTTPTYDNNGNMKTDAGSAHTYVYDAWDRLVVEGNGFENVRYNYDARGYRVERIAGGVSTYYHYTNDWRLLEERLIGSGVGPVVASYVWGERYVDSLVLRDHVTHGRQYAQQDANFNVTSITDSSGAAQERYVYDPYGKATYRTGSWGARAGRE